MEGSSLSCVFTCWTTVCPDAVYQSDVSSIVIISSHICSWQEMNHLFIIHTHGQRKMEPSLHISRKWRPCFLSCHKSITFTSLSLKIYTHKSAISTVSIIKRHLPNMRSPVSCGDLRFISFTFREGGLRGSAAWNRWFCWAQLLVASLWDNETCQWCRCTIRRPTACYHSREIVAIY